LKKVPLKSGFFPSEAEMSCVFPFLKKCDTVKKGLRTSDLEISLDE
jgi:hypothetical protein